MSGWEVAVAILTSSALTALLGGLMVRRRTSAEVNRLHVETADKLVTMTNSRMESMAADIERLTAELELVKARLAESDTDRERLTHRVEQLHAHIDTLEAVMRERDIEPPPRPRGDL